MVWTLPQVSTNRSQNKEVIWSPTWIVWIQSRYSNSKNKIVVLNSKTNHLINKPQTLDWEYWGPYLWKKGYQIPLCGFHYSTEQQTGKKKNRPGAFSTWRRDKKNSLGLARKTLRPTSLFSHLTPIMELPCTLGNVKLWEFGKQLWWGNHGDQSQCDYTPWNSWWPYLAGAEGSSYKGQTAPISVLSVIKIFLNSFILLLS